MLCTYTEFSDELINECFNVKESLVTHMYLIGHGRKAEWGGSYWRVKPSK